MAPARTVPDPAAVTVVVDTNVLWADVTAQRPMLRAVFDGAASGDYEIAVPQIVVDELRRQYPERLRDLELTIRSALGKLSPEFARLNVDPPVLPSYDVDGMAAAYQTDLAERLRGTGVRTVPHPGDLSPVLEWAVAKRAPFKREGQGLPDAIIWLTVLEIARSGRQILLLTENVKDFGAFEDGDGLAPALADDLRRWGIAAERIRLVTGARSFVEERLPVLAAPDRRASLLVTEQSRRSRLIAAIERALYFTPLPNTDLELDLELADGPQASALDIEALEVTDTRQLEDGRLLLDISVVADADLLIYVAHSDVEELPDGFSVTNYEWNERFAEAETAAVLRITAGLVTDPQAASVEVDLLGALELEAHDVVTHRLERLKDELFEILDEVVTATAGNLAVAGFVPEQPLEGLVDIANAARIKFMDPEPEEVEELGGFAYSVDLSVRATADIAWTVTHPTAADIRDNPEAVQGSSGQEWLSGLAVSQPLEVRVSAVSTPSGWEQATIDEVLLDVVRQAP